MIRVTIPDPWKAEVLGLPEMSSTEDGVFRARREIVEEPWLMEVRWSVERKAYLCRIGQNSNVEDFADSREIPYPHEVIAWMTTWFSLLKKIEGIFKKEERGGAAKSGGGAGEG